LSTHNFQKDDKGKITIDDDVIMQQIVWQVVDKYWWYCVAYNLGTITVSKCIWSM